jgi:hypothetical protein
MKSDSIFGKSRRERSEYPWKSRMQWNWSHANCSDSSLTVTAILVNVTRSVKLNYRWLAKQKGVCRLFRKQFDDPLGFSIWAAIFFWYRFLPNICGLPEPAGYPIDSALLFTTEFPSLDRQNHQLIFPRMPPDWSRRANNWNLHSALHEWFQLSRTLSEGPLQREKWVACCASLCPISIVYEWFAWMLYARGWLSW